MADLSEQDIFRRMDDSFKEAIDLCNRMARGERGSCYRLLRAHLGHLEGTFRQMGWWREDARWLAYEKDRPTLGRFQYDDQDQHSLVWVVAKAHESAGKWLREKHPNWKFAKLAQVLAAAHKAAERLRHRPTERRGTILPRPLEGEHRDTRPVQVMTPGGIILPRTVH